MAQPVYLFLKAAGNDIEGESTVKSLEREGSIECLSFKDGVRTAREKGSAIATGDRTYEPLVIEKRIDKSTPLLAKALCKNEDVEGTFKFYRPSPTGDGTQQHFFTIEIKEAKVSGIERVSPDTLDPASAEAPPTERVSFVFGRIIWTYEDGGQTHEDHWSQRE